MCLLLVKKQEVIQAMRSCSINQFIIFFTKISKANSFVSEPLIWDKVDFFSGIMVGRDINSTLLASYDWPSFFGVSPHSPARVSLVHPWCQSSPGGVKTLELIDSCQTLAMSSQQPGHAMRNRLKSGKMSKCNENVWTCLNKYISGARSRLI